ncbi:hypothetical protein [Stomatohabitans albus]|uniref:hypothetical protein n=1 Tax=Stomatohabitans albus TaxID=3110766 RepID=UPI00300DAD50
MRETVISRQSVAFSTTERLLPADPIWVGGLTYLLSKIAGAAIATMHQPSSPIGSMGSVVAMNTKPDDLSSNGYLANVLIKMNNTCRRCIV